MPPPSPTQIYLVVMNVYVSTMTQTFMGAVQNLPNSPVLIGGVALSSLVLAVSPPVLTTAITLLPPPSSPPRASPPQIGFIPILGGSIGGCVLAVGVCMCTYCYERRKKRRRNDEKYAADAAAEAAIIAQGASEQRRREAAEDEAERERRAKEAREAAQVTLMAKLVVEWSSLQLLYEVHKGGMGAVWEASLDLAADDGKVVTESLLATGKAHLAKVDGSGDAGATRVVPAGRFVRFARPVDAHADGLNARILSEDLIARQSHAALVEMTLRLHAISPPGQSHPHVLPVLGIATNNGRRYALLTPKCTTSLQKLLHLAENTLSLRLSLITEWNNVACGIADGLKFLHGQRIAHAALHPGNVLMDAQMQPQLADYGPSMCRLRAAYARTKAGQLNLQRRDDALGAEPIAGSEPNLYLSPEILPSVGTAHLWSAARALDIPSDVWALGCLVARLVTLKPLYYKESLALYEALAQKTADERAAAARVSISAGIWRPAVQLEGEDFLPTGLLELVDSCTAMEPTQRPSSKMVHSWLERMRKEEEEGGSDGYVLPTPIKPPVTVNRIAQAYGAVVSVSSLPEQASPVWRLWA
jgi:serine/threonine protein kinase